MMRQGFLLLPRDPDEPRDTCSTGRRGDHHRGDRPDDGRADQHGRHEPSRRPAPVPFHADAPEPGHAGVRVGSCVATTGCSAFPAEAGSGERGRPGPVCSGKGTRPGDRPIAILEPLPACLRRQ